MSAPSISEKRPRATTRALHAILVIALAAGALVGTAPRATAHRFVHPVPRIQAGRAVPVVDGACSATDYTGARRYELLYQVPSFNWRAPFHLFASATDLFVCVSNLPARQTTGESPDLLLGFDADDSGSVVPDGNDLLISFDEDARLSAFRGSGGGGWTGLASCPCTATGNIGGEISWGVELRIPLSEVRVSPDRLSGFVIQHAGYVPSGGTRTDFTHPGGAVLSRPATWADLQWGLAPTAPAVRLDAVRVTQGQETDALAGVDYRLVAGKKTLVRAHLYNAGRAARAISATCRVDGPSATTLMPANLPAEPIGFTSTGTTATGSRFDCWIPGFALTSGISRFRLLVTLEDNVTRTIELGTRVFTPTKDERLLLWPATYASDDRRMRAYDGAMRAAAAAQMTELMRIFPVRQGVGAVSLNDTAPPAAGIRFTFFPNIWSCPTGVTGRNVADSCENRSYVSANWDINWANTISLPLAGARDRLDHALIQFATPGTMGGRACWPDEAQIARGTLLAAFNEIDATPDGSSAEVQGQELLHCLGQLDHFDGLSTRSPHRIPTDQWHSRNAIVPPPRFDVAAVNTTTEQDVPAAKSLMFPTFNPGEASSRVFIEGWDWNNTIAEALAPAASGAVAASDAVAVAGPEANGLFSFNGFVDLEGNVRPYFTKEVAAGALTPTPATPGGTWSMAFLSGTGAVLSALPFNPPYAHTHDHDVPGEGVGLSLVAPIPDGTKRVELRQGTKVRFNEVVSTAAPVVRGVTATPTAGGIRLAWTGSDANADRLTYDVFVRFQPGGPLQPLYHGLTTTSYLYPTALAPQSTAATFVVEASDGFRTGSAESGRVAIAAQPPVAAIATPTAGSIVVAGRPVRLEGLGYDVASRRSLAGAALTWSSDRDGSLGAGTSLAGKLSVGTHVVTLTATSPAGLKTTTSTTVTVVPDGDGDGMADKDEAAAGCLVVGKADASADVDADDVANARELSLGTNPCERDTDDDGYADGEEVSLGSSPSDPKRIPTTPKLTTATRQVDLGTCPTAKTSTVGVQVPAGVAWKMSDRTATWFDAKGGGTGNGSISITPKCGLLTKPWTYTGDILVQAAGELRRIEVRVRGAG